MNDIPLAVVGAVAAIHCECGEFVGEFESEKRETLRCKCGRTYRMSYDIRVYEVA
jgi:hypothetical protein